MFDNPKLHSVSNLQMFEGSEMTGWTTGFNTSSENMMPHPSDFMPAL